jgi:hypothetical protein
MSAKPLIGSVPSTGPGESYAPREAHHAKKLDPRPLTITPNVVAPPLTLCLRGQPRPLQRTPPSPTPLHLTTCRSLWHCRACAPRFVGPHGENRRPIEAPSSQRRPCRVRVDATTGATVHAPMPLQLGRLGSVLGQPGNS